MKKKLIYLFMIVCSLSVFTACNDDDDEDDMKAKLVGTWNLKSSNAFDMVWEAPDNVNVSGIPVSSIATMVGIAGNTTITERLRDVTFLSDGKIEATYYDDEAELWVKAENYATYKLSGKDKLLLYVDADKAFADKNMDAATMAALKLMLTAGIPVYYEMYSNATDARFYLDTKTIKAARSLIPVLLTLVAGDNSDMIEMLVGGLSDALDKSTKVEIALNFDKAN